MKVLMLRGQVPRDRDPAEIAYRTLQEESDLWTHLAMAMGDTVEVLYWGGKRKVKYDDKKSIVWVPSFKNYRPDFTPDIIFARGAFPEYHDILRRFPCSFKLFYGAGKRHVPIKGFSDYQVTLQDSRKQLERARKKFPGIKHVLWTKPVPPQFYPRASDKKFDVCYIANGGQADIKRIPWVYKTAPSHLKILHLGLKSKYKPPKNVTCKRVLKEDMPHWISRCKVGIVPYKSVDSAPRVIYEMLACGLQLFICDEVNFNLPENIQGCLSVPLESIWETLGTELILQELFPFLQTVDAYKQLSIKTAAKNLLRIYCDHIIFKTTSIPHR